MMIVLVHVQVVVDVMMMRRRRRRMMMKKMMMILIFCQGMILRSSVLVLAAIVSVDAQGCVEPRIEHRHRNGRGDHSVCVYAHVRICGREDG